MKYERPTTWGTVAAAGAAEEDRPLVADQLAGDSKRRAQHNRSGTARLKLAERRQKGKR